MKNLFSISLTHSSGHNGEELWEINNASTFFINFINQVLKFSVCWVLTKRSHNCYEFIVSNCAITILIEKGESLLELSNLFFS